MLSATSREAVIAYIALGANLGDARSAIRLAMEQIGALPQTQLLVSSSLYRTAPVESSGDDYINAVIKISTTLPAYSLLSLRQNIEHAAGRQRPYLNAPRTLDLDVLLYGSASIDNSVLTVPHPRMMQRAFVLLPLQEISPELVSSVDLQHVADQRIEKIYQP
jgi:2-amino-4-hydroxy-6-hydroxymethyldihydropteridine diphosphokinase